MVTGNFLIAYIACIMLLLDGADVDLSTGSREILFWGNTYASYGLRYLEQNLSLTEHECVFL